MILHKKRLIHRFKGIYTNTIPHTHLVLLLEVALTKAEIPINWFLVKFTLCAVITVIMPMKPSFLMRVFDKYV